MSPKFQLYLVQFVRIGQIHLIVSPDESAEISFGRDNLKNILVGTFKFGMWVYMGNATNDIIW